MNKYFAYIFAFTGTLFILTPLIGMFHETSPHAMFSQEYKELVEHLKPYERQFFASIFYNDIDKINALITSCTSNSTPVTSTVRDCLFDILAITYPELASEKKHVWKQQKEQQHPALNIAALLLTYNTFHSNNLSNQNTSDTISNTTYQRLLSLCSKRQESDISDHVGGKILAILETIENTQNLAPSYSADTHWPRQPSWGSQLIGQMCTFFGCSSGDDSCTELSHEQSDASNYELKAGEEEVVQFSYYNENKDNANLEQKTSPLATRNQNTMDINPKIAFLLLSKRETLFQPFKNLPS